MSWAGSCRQARVRMPLQALGHAVTKYPEEAGGDALEWVDDCDGSETTPKG